MANAMILDELAEDSPDRGAVLAQLHEPAPALRAVGVLDVFVPRSPAIVALLAEPD
ncbi:MAG: hypothetical protein M3Y17_05790 [Actinomycetota bacterium]|nr:hypothetical protein [Actinomycetota bacterium]